MSFSSPAPSSISFGLGCFAFEMAAADEDKEVLYETWRSEVETALGKISSVEKVAVTLGSMPLRRDRWMRKAAISGPPTVRVFEPNPLGARIAFEIKIPKRLHSNLLDGQIHDSERFRVETVYGYYGPCTFVSCIDSTGDGALAVRLLWRFLRQQLPRTSDSVVFTLLGPSPYHASFMLEKDDEAEVGDQSFRWEVVRRVGYEDVLIRYSSSVHDNEMKAFQRVQTSLVRELSLFYWLERLGNYEHEYSGYLAEKASALIKAHNATGVKATVDRIFRSASNARRLGLDALGAKLLYSRNEKSAREFIASTYSQTDAVGCLRDSVERNLPAATSPELEMALEVVRFAEAGRTKELEIAIVSASTLLGAAAGAIAAVVAG